MQIFHAHEQGFCVATHGCLVVAVWGRGVEIDDLGQIAAAQRRAVAQHRHCASISIIRAWLSVGVSPEIRAAAAEHLQALVDVNLGSAMVVEAGGARAIFFRSVVTSVNLLARTRTPQKVFTTIDEAVGWALARPGLDPATAAASEQITAAAHELADRYGSK